MIETLNQLLHFDRFGWRSLVDVLLLSTIIYQILRIFRGTRATRMLSGILVLVVAYILTEPGRLLALPTVNRVLGALLLFAPFAIVVLFVNHIRRMLSLVGSNPLAGLARTPAAEKMIEEIVLAAVTLASKRHGALIVIEREQGLRSFAETGIEIDAMVSYDLLTTIFVPHAPMHDGAVIIAEGRIRAASCFLPLTTGRRLGREFGSRHRAAIGITEETDAVALVVSEETGTVALVREGRIRRGLEPHELTAALSDLLLPARRRKQKDAEGAEPSHEAGAAPAAEPLPAGEGAHKGVLRPAVKAGSAVRSAGASDPAGDGEAAAVPGVPGGTDPGEPR